MMRTQAAATAARTGFHALAAVVFLGALVGPGGLAGCAHGNGGRSDQSPTLAPEAVRPRDRVGTEIEFVLERPQDVTVTVRDLDGEDVAVIYDGFLPAGGHLLVWDGKDERGREMPHGMYLATVAAADYSRTVRLTYTGEQSKPAPGGVND